MNGASEDSERRSIELENIGMSHPGFAPILDGVSLSTARGETVSILGRSGCGKSTLLNIAAGFETPTHGGVRISGSLGYIAQDSTLMAWRTALENALLPLELRGRITGAMVESTRRLFAQLGLAGAESKYPDELSGGMRQRVALAQLILQDPDVVLLDEPFSALDCDIRLRLGRSLREWVRDGKKSALLVTHFVDEAIIMGDRIAVLDGTPATVALELQNPLPESARTADLIRSNGGADRLFRALLDILNTSEQSPRFVQ